MDGWEPSTILNLTLRRMRFIQIKILFGFFSLLVLGAAGVGAFWVYKKIILPETEGMRMVKESEGKKSPKHDPGIVKYEEAVQLLKSGEQEASVAALRHLLKYYPDSSRFGDARRIIGELNMDAFLAPGKDSHPSKKDYMVRSGDTLIGIAKRNDMTIDALIRANNLTSILLHPKDQLVVFPLDFSISIDAGDKTLTLKQGEDAKFFKDYPVAELNLPPGSSLPLKTKVKSKAAWLGEKTIKVTSPLYAGTSKWISLAKPGFVIRSAEERGKGKTAPGIWMARADVEELFTILRTGAAVTLAK